MRLRAVTVPENNFKDYKKLYKPLTGFQNFFGVLEQSFTTLKGTYQKDLDPAFHESLGMSMLI